MVRGDTKILRGLAIAVCAVTPLPVTVKAQGIVRADGEGKIVQASTEGVVTKISGEVNQKIAEGETIAILNDRTIISAKADLERINEEKFLCVLCAFARYNNPLF